MKRLLFSTFTSLCAIMAMGQEKPLADKVLFTVETDTVTAGEYMAVYNKNRDVGQEIDPKTPAEYLDLYLNFKLKVHEAKELGRDTMPSFLKEYHTYREQLAQPYLSDKEVTEELIREAYQRKQYDVRASHIMVKLPREATPADTAAAYAEIMVIKKRLDNDEDFATLARTESDDTYSAERGGDLGYFTVFNMVYPFETAAFETPLNEVSEPVRSEYGYHLVKPTDKREARGEITVAHIMLIDNEQSTSESSQNTKERIYEIYGKLKDGENFQTLVAQYSDDKTSAMQDGLLQPFGINKMYPEFEEAAFALRDSGDFSEPIKTPVGWHILQLIKPAVSKPFEEAKDDLRAKVERDVRAQQSRESVIKRLKKEYEFREYPKKFDQAFNQVDESLLSGRYQAQNIENEGTVLVEFSGEEYTVAHFLTWLEKNQKSYSRGSKLQAQLYQAISDFGDEKILALEKAALPNKYPEFRLLDREYYEGILLFDLTDEKVWRKAMTDTTGLKAFYQANKDNYMWGQRVNGYVVSTANKKQAKKAIALLKEGKEHEAVLMELNSDSKLAAKIDSGTYEIKELELLQEVEAPEKGASDIAKINDRYHFVYVLQKLAPAAKELNETRGRVISDYQEHLEKEWIKSLRGRYEVEINQEVLKKVIQELEAGV